MNYAPATMQQTIPTDYRIIVNAMLQSYSQIFNTILNMYVAHQRIRKLDRVYFFCIYLLDVFYFAMIA